jgi:hypothetical protein
MRTKSSKTLYFNFYGESSIKVAKEYRAKYEAISQILDANPQVLRLAHRDWPQWLSTSAKGRDGYTSDQLLHTELIKRGKAAKPIEFGHKVLFCQTGEKFIHHYQVMPRRIEDKELLAPALEAHKDLFGDYPNVLSTDKGFYESMKQILALEEKIVVVSIAKKGRRTPEEYARETTAEFLAGQRFRAGAEGSISVLKRAFKLGKCFFQGI